VEDPPLEVDRPANRQAALNASRAWAVLERRKRPESAQKGQLPIERLQNPIQQHDSIPLGSASEAVDADHLGKYSIKN
jgi:hypothetical protein